MYVWWVFIIIVVTTFMALMACLRMAKESDERLYKQGHKPEKEDNIELLFSCAHTVVDVEVHSLKQLLKNQGYGRMVMDAVDPVSKGIHAVIDSNYQQAVTNKLEADFYICNEQSYQDMLKGLVGYMADIDGYEQGHKLINDWIQFHDDWIADHRNHES